MSRILVMLLALVLAMSTIGAEGCDSETGGSGAAAGHAKKKAKERAAKAKRKARAKRRHRAAKPPPVQPANCDPSYSGCLDPGAGDYDCSGGDGDGPKFTGPVSVKGPDHYDLDPDGDGSACESEP